MELNSIFSWQNIPVYFLFISLLYCGLLIYAHRRAQKHSKSGAVSSQISLLIMISGFIGARFFHVLFEAPFYYLNNPEETFYFWQGGFVFYGGFVFSLVTVLIYLRKQRLDFFEWADFYAPVFALGYGLGRMACFISGCCYGSYCTLPWAIDQRHPVQLYAVLWELVLWFILIQIENKKDKLKTGHLFLTWLIGHSIGRIVMEFFRDDFRGPHWGGQSIATWISIVILLTSLGLWRRFNLEK
jgi:phosphatidylglycerol---prolipoprotein diacylglyceryl transferase